jgi:peroxiredoxin
VFGAALAAVVAVGLGIGLLTSTGSPAGGWPPRAGSIAPPFALAGLNVGGRVGTPLSREKSGRPVVLLFMGDWCTICHSEIPPLAAKIRTQEMGHGALGRIAVIGVDSEDTLSDARNFIKAAGVTFPVGDDSTAHVMNALYGFEGDPYAVFIEGSGQIMAIHPGPLSPAQLIAFEQELVSKR